MNKKLRKILKRVLLLSFETVYKYAGTLLISEMIKVKTDVPWESYICQVQKDSLDCTL